MAKAKKPDIAAMFGAAKVKTFLGLPAAKLDAPIRAKTGIFGIASATPYRHVGAYCRNAPKAIRAGIAGYAANILHMDFDLGEPIFPEGKVSAVDFGDLPFDARNAARNRERVSKAAAAILDAGAVPIVFGGDDSVPIPFLQAYEGHGRFTVLQYDAHIDWREEVRGEKWGLSSTMRHASEMGHIERIVQVGRRAIGSAREEDRKDAERWGVKFFGTREVAGNGIGLVLDAIPKGSNVILSCDVDGLDPSIVPGVIGPAPGGLIYWQAVELLHGAAGKGRLAGATFVEFVPELDVNGMGAMTVSRLAAHALALAVRAR
jgi:agmatinase